MARNTAVQVLDDLTGDPAAETVGFGLDGIDYNIDLSSANAEALRGLLQRYADAGRRTGGRRNRPRIVPGAQRSEAKRTAPKPAAAKAAKAAPAKTKAAAAKAAEPAKTTRVKAEPAKPARAKKAAEPKPTTRAVARKVPTVTFSAAE